MSGVYLCLSLSSGNKKSAKTKRHTAAQKGAASEGIRGV